jgi:hypothetical protein
MIELEGVFVSTDAISNDRDAVDLIAKAHYDHEAQWVVLGVDQLPADFFQLRTGVAGAIVQKFVNYRMRLAIVGDVPAQVADSEPVRDWIREANRGRDLWFVPDLAALEERLRG